jgi:cytokinin dehydrogenase
MSRLTEPPPPLDGEIRFDGRARAAAAEDFWHLVHRSPEGVLLPASDEDVAAAVRWTAGQGRRFAAQGTRHSVFGRAQVRDGIVADLRRLRTVDHVQHDRVVADAGATWREVVATTLPLGLVPPVLTDYLDLSVAGTLVAGGVGSRTWRFGAQSDNVLDLQADATLLAGLSDDRPRAQPSTLPYLDTSLGSPRWSRRSDPVASGGSRIHG